MVVKASDEPAAAAVPSPQRVSLAEATRLWWKIGWLSFGGPAAQIALMHRELVERRRWISEPRFLHALNYCMLLPGPEAQQLAIYVGWLMHRTWGGIVAGTLFVLPGFCVILALSALYARFSELATVTAVFFGLKAAVLAIVVEAVIRIGRRALRNGFLVSVAAAAFVGIYFLKIPFPFIVAGAAVAGLIGRRLAPHLFPERSAAERAGDSHYLVDRLLDAGELRHTRPCTRRALGVLTVCLLLWFVPVLAAWLALGGGHVLSEAGVFFSQTAVVTFGGAYAVLAYVAQRAVEARGWVSPGEMLDGLALAETTPGPLILVLPFIGFLAAFRFPGPLDPWVAAVAGAALTTWVLFVPCFLFIFLGAPYVEALRRQSALNAALSSITAAVVGVILNLSIWFAVRTVFGTVRTHELGWLRVDVPQWHTVEPGALGLAALALVAVLRFHVPLGWVLLGCAAGGAGYWTWQHGLGG